MDVAQADDLITHMLRDARFIVITFSSPNLVKKSLFKKPAKKLYSLKPKEVEQVNDVFEEVEDLSYAQ